MGTIGTPGPMETMENGKNFLIGTIGAIRSMGTIGTMGAIGNLETVGTMENRKTSLRTLMKGEKYLKEL